MTQSLNCPNCGAAAGPDAVRCDYCGSRLATIACPSCFGSLFVGSEFCPHCGTKAAAPDVVGNESLPCPGCRGSMRHVRIGRTEMHQCESCGSAWLTRDGFSALCADREE